MTPPFRALRNFRYDDRRDQYRADYGGAPTQELLVDVALALAEVLGVDTDEIEPLHRCLDTDAFDALVGSGPTGEGLVGGPVAFRVEGCRVTVTTDELTFERLD
ncbi:HalOD1 output domain-containing protein [Halobium salinum]|uniref:HalOD1 output domain-containing protein n=1 Tax=Halobium salinum TaxID=1364940 RepID=A0ABD5PDT4_9EURY|nr:HalOD1 output domain-containing protein [Halobium salinum]